MTATMAETGRDAENPTHTHPHPHPHPNPLPLPLPLPLTRTRTHTHTRTVAPICRDSLRFNFRVEECLLLFCFRSEISAFVTATVVRIHRAKNATSMERSTPLPLLPSYRCGPTPPGPLPGHSEMAAVNSSMGVRVRYGRRRCQAPGASATAPDRIVVRASTGRSYRREVDPRPPPPPGLHISSKASRDRLGDG